MTRAAAGLLAAVVLGGMMIGAGAPGADAAPGPSDAPQYWFDQWQVTNLWNAGARGQGVVIAELDTGVNAALPELAGTVLPGKDFGAGGDGRVDRAVDGFGHGTAMASIMVAHPGLLGITGLAPDARVLPVALPIKGTQDAVDTDRLPEAIRYAVDAGAKIVNLSLGDSRTPGPNDAPCGAEEQAAITYAVAKGAVVVAASGNSGQSGSPVEDPAVCLGVVSVGAVDAKGAVADFSSRHRYLSVTAPGVEIASLGRNRGQAYSGSGTSQATALTSAVLALVWSAHPNLTGRQVVSRLMATVHPHGTGHDPAYGYGAVDAFAAVTAAVPDTAGNPVYDTAQPVLDRAAAAQKGIPTPPAASVAPAPPGTVTVGSRPEDSLGTQAKAGIGAGIAGLVLLAGAAVGLVRRRRRVLPLASGDAGPDGAGRPVERADHAAQ